MHLQKTQILKPEFFHSQVYPDPIENVAIAEMSILCALGDLFCFL